MRKIVIISLAVALLFIPSLVTGCSSDDSDGDVIITDLEGKIRWTETGSFGCSYYEDWENYSNALPYKATISGEFELIGSDTVEVCDIIIRLYNADGGVVGEKKVVDESRYGSSANFTPTYSRRVSGEIFCEEMATSYDMFAINNEGNEYLVIK